MTHREDNPPTGLVHVVRTFWPMLWQKKCALFFAYAMSLASVAALVLSPWPLKLIIDNVLGGDPLPALLSGLAVNDSKSAWVIGLAAASALLAALGALASAREKKLHNRLREAMALDLRDRMLTHLQTLSENIRQRHSTGDLVLRLIDDVHQLVRLLTRTTPLVIRHLIAMVATFAVMFWVEPLLALLCLVIVLVLAVLVRKFSSPLHAASRQKRKLEGTASGLAQEIVRGLKTTQVLGREGSVRKRFHDFNRKSLHAGVEEADIAVGMEQTLQTANGVAVGLVIGGSALLVLAGHLTVGELTVFATYILQLLKPVEKINELYSAVARGVARGELLIGLFNIAPEVEDTGDIVHLEAGPKTLRIENLSFFYPGQNQGHLVFEDLNLTLEPGRLTVLTGASGSGKSTLLYLLLRLFTPNAGEIYLNGQPYSRLGLKALRSQFAVMLQETHLFADTVRGILEPPGESDDERLWHALGQVGLDQYVRNLPGRLDAVLNEEGLSLSGGQRARLSLCRALLMERPILILDEPFANVDMASQAIILDALEGYIAGGGHCLALTHQSLLLERADVLLKLENRRIIEIAASQAAGGNAR